MTRAGWILCILFALVVGLVGRFFGNSFFLWALGGFLGFFVLFGFLLLVHVIQERSRRERPWIKIVDPELGDCWVKVEDVVINMLSDDAVISAYSDGGGRGDFLGYSKVTKEMKGMTPYHL